MNRELFWCIHYDRFSNTLHLSTQIKLTLPVMYSKLSWTPKKLCVYIDLSRDNTLPRVLVMKLMSSSGAASGQYNWKISNLPSSKYIFNIFAKKQRVGCSSEIAVAFFIKLMHLSKATYKLQTALRLLHKIKDLKCMILTVFRWVGCQGTGCIDSVK